MGKHYYRIAFTHFTTFIVTGSTCFSLFQLLYNVLNTSFVVCNPVIYLSSINRFLTNQLCMYNLLLS
jgi:hypothetical protein